MAGIFMAGTSDSSSAFEERPLMRLPWGDVLSRRAYSFYALRVQDVILPGALSGSPRIPRRPVGAPFVPGPRLHVRSGPSGHRDGHPEGGGSEGLSSGSPVGMIYVPQNS